MATVLALKGDSIFRKMWINIQREVRTDQLSVLIDRELQPSDFGTLDIEDWSMRGALLSGRKLDRFVQFAVNGNNVYLLGKVRIHV